MLIGRGASPADSKVKLFSNLSDNILLLLSSSVSRKVSRIESGSASVLCLLNDRRPQFI